MTITRPDRYQTVNCPTSVTQSAASPISGKVSSGSWPKVAASSAIRVSRAAGAGGGPALDRSWRSSKVTAGNSSSPSAVHMLIRISSPARSCVV